MPIPHMRIFVARLSLFLTALLLGGCALVSGDKPLAVSASDRALIDRAHESVGLDVPLVTHPIAGRKMLKYVVGFDGTMNDRARVPPGERETIVASLTSKLGGIYYPGPGMQSPSYRNVIDGIFGYSSANIAETAAAKFLTRARDWINDSPDGEIRVIVTGFSRGAAIARHFMNVVDPAAEHDPLLRHRVYFYVILFDTVSTGQFDSLQLSVPASVDYLVHFVARDESRFLFKPVIDSEPEIITKVFKIGGAPIPERINLILLPGAHSDVGGSYAGGIGYLYQQLTEQLLHQMGLIEQDCWETPDDVVRAGKHDSRGLIDRLGGATPPNSDATVARTLLTVPFPNPDVGRVEENAARLGDMVLANVQRGVMMHRHWNELIYPRLTLLRKGQLISVLDWQPAEYIDGSSFTFSNAGNVRRLSYRFLPPNQGRISTILLSDPIWNRLPEDRPAILSYSGLARGKDEQLMAYVDDVLASSNVSTRSGEPAAVSRKQKCEVDANGQLRSPMRMFIIEPKLTPTAAANSK